MGGRRILGVTAAALVIGTLTPAGESATAGESEGAAAGRLAVVTARSAEGSPAMVLGRGSKILSGNTRRITPVLRRKTGSALRASAIVQGRRPDRRMPVEPYIPQNACYAGEMTGVQAFRDMLLQTFPRSERSLGIYNISRGCNSPGVSEHEEGRALDFEANVGDPVQYAQARRLLKYLTKRRGYHAKRWGIMYIIFDQQIWAQYRPYWRRMADRGNPTDNHKDHIHFSFTWNGAVKQAPYWTGTVRAPDRGPCVRYQWHFAPVLLDRMAVRPRTGACRRPRPFDRSWNYSSSIMFWQSDARVKWLQQFLAEEGVYSAEVNGAFGQITYGAVREWQIQHGLPPTGVWDPVTQDRSGRMVAQRGKTTITGWPDQITVGAEPYAVPVTVTADGVLGRQMTLQRRAVGSSEWEALGELQTDATGDYTVAIPTDPGSWEYRLVVAESSKFRSAKTAVSVVTVATAPVPPSIPAPDPVPPTGPTPPESPPAVTPDPVVVPPDAD